MPKFTGENRRHQNTCRLRGKLSFRSRRLSYNNTLTWISTKSVKCLCVFYKKRINIWRFWWNTRIAFLSSALCLFTVIQNKFSAGLKTYISSHLVKILQRYSETIFWFLFEVPGILSVCCSCFDDFIYSFRTLGTGPGMYLICIFVCLDTNRARGHRRVLMCPSFRTFSRRPYSVIWQGGGHSRGHSSFWNWPSWRDVIAETVFEIVTLQLKRF